MREMSFYRPDTLIEALDLLAGDEDAACLSGGATLVAMMNAELVSPSALVSLAGIPELGEAERLKDGSVRIGAMRLHRQTAFETDLRGGQKVVGEAAAAIANPPVRNMGTIGGAIAFADPAADYPPALVAADAVIEVASADGRREIPAPEFFTDWYETALAPNEMVTAVTLPPGPPGALGRYHKLARVSGDFATVSVALVLAMEAGACAHVAIAVGGCGPIPARLTDVEAALVGGGLDAAAVAVAGAALAEMLDPVDDVRASADYRRKVAPRMIARAIIEAKAELEGAG